MILMVKYCIMKHLWGDFMQLLLNEEALDFLITETIQQELQPNDISNLLRTFSEDVFERSQKYVPVKNGNLKKSGKIQYKNNSYYITYKTDYALYVHEIINNYHKPPTRSKYLENAFYSVYREYYLEFGIENLPKFDYIMSYSLEKIEMKIFIKGGFEE